MRHMHNCGVSDPAIPRAPLPLPRYARAAVIGPTSDTGRHDLLRQAMAPDPLLDAMLPVPPPVPWNTEHVRRGTP
jgi:hypothetical protein